MENQTLYRFKYDNVSLDDYLRERRAIARTKRIAAESLMRDAKTIEEEAETLEAWLIPAPTKDI